MSMPIRFACDGCGKAFSVKDDLAGKKGKCTACGAAMMIPMASVFVANLTPAPMPAPAFHAAPPANVQVVVGPQQPQDAGLPANGLGVAGVVIGGLCLAIAWIPLLNILVIPGTFLGGLLALVGLIVAVSSKRTGVGFPVAGMGLNVIAVTLMVVTNIVAAGALGALK
jgi:hypothetical protein